MNWKEQFTIKFGQPNLENEFLDDDMLTSGAINFIQTEIIEKLIADIGNDDWAVRIPPANQIPMTQLKQQLKDQWL